MLIVDDHPTFRQFARRLLEEAGFAVVGEAVDGACAIEAARELQPTAVLLDVLLPDVSGLDVAAVLAARRIRRPSFSPRAAARAISARRSARRRAWLHPEGGVQRSRLRRAVGAP